MAQPPCPTPRAPAARAPLRAGLGLPAVVLLASLCGCAGLRGPLPEPAVQRSETEDDHVQVSELKVRGQVQRISVTPKDSNAPRYEITPPAAGSDPSQHRDGSGRRVWQILSF